MSNEYTNITENARQAPVGGMATVMGTPTDRQNAMMGTPTDRQTAMMGTPTDRQTAMIGTPTEKEPKDERLQALCGALNLPADILSRVDSLWTVFQRSGIEQLQNSYIGSYLCSVYIASVDSRLPYGVLDPQVFTGTLDPPCVTVTDLLKRAKYSIIEFFKLFQVLKVNVQLSDAVRVHLLNLEKKYLITCPLFHKFERIFDDLFQEDDPGSAQTPGSASEQREYLERKHFAWTLFIFTKSRVTDTSELVFNFHLLLCCLNYVLRLTPGFLLKPPFDTLRVAFAENDADLQMLRQLSETYQANYDDVKLVQISCLDPVIAMLPQADGSLDEETMKNFYWTQYRNIGDIDELMFMSYDSHLGLTPREQNNNLNVQREADSDSDIVNGSEGTTDSRTGSSNGAANGVSTLSTNNSGFNSSVQADPASVLLTPVRAALTSVQHLQSMLTHIGDSGSDVLRSIFEQCAVNPQPFISSLLSEMKPVFIKGYMNTMGKNRASIAELRFNLAVKLYYKVMESLLRQEKDRLSEDNFSNLLHNEVSHKCLLACSVEVVMAAYNSNTLKMPAPQSPSSLEIGAGSTMFPWVLQVFSLHGFDLFIVLENFIHVESKLSKVVLKHLQAVEQRLLESAAWKSGSPLFEALSYCEITNEADTSNLQNDATGQADNSVHHLLVRGPEGSSINSPRFQRSHGLNRFLNKVCRLAYKRLQILCCNLKLAKDLVLKIWTCLEYCITRRQDIMKNRHIDQVIMCCLYAICRVIDQEIKFKTIVAVYKDMAHASQQTYKRVLLSGDEYDSIIVFYNKVFTQSLKTYILQFAANRIANTKSPRPGSGVGNTASPRPGMASPRPGMASPRPGMASPRIGVPASPHVGLTASPVPGLQASPLYSLPGHRNFYISPLKGNQFKSPGAGQVDGHVTPRTRQLISLSDGFGSEEKFKGINSWMKTRVNQKMPGGSKSSKRLAFDLMDEAAMGAGDDEPMMLGKRRKPSASKSLPFSTYQEPVGKDDVDKKS